MSIQVSQRVWEHSKQKGSCLLVLLALADFCNDGTLCWPGVETLAHKARLKERYVQVILARLQHAGEIYRGPARGRGRSNVYAILVGPSRTAILALLKNKFHLAPEELRRWNKRVHSRAPRERVRAHAPQGARPRQKGALLCQKGALPRTQNHQEPSDRTIRKEPSTATPCCGCCFLSFLFFKTRGEDRLLLAGDGH